MLFVRLAVTTIVGLVAWVPYSCAKVTVACPVRRLVFLSIALLALLSGLLVVAYLDTVLSRRWDGYDLPAYLDYARLVFVLCALMSVMIFSADRILRSLRQVSDVSRLLFYVVMAPCLLCLWWKFVSWLYLPTRLL